MLDLVSELADMGVPKYDTLLFTLARASAHPDIEVRRRAYQMVPEICGMSTHLFHFLQFVQDSRGWSRGVRKAVSRWYNEMPENRLALQAIKYRQRDGWTHTDSLRLAHVKPQDDAHEAIYEWIVKGATEKTVPALIEGFEKIQNVSSAKDAAALVSEYRLPREAVPTEFLNDVEVWAALLPDMPVMATIRNLGNMTKLGLLRPMSTETQAVIEKLAAVKRAKVHPLQVLVALQTYKSGTGFRGGASWDAVGEIVDALDEAFYTAFGNVQPANKRTMLALDVSGSMDWGQIAGMPGITPRVGSAAMAMVTARSEPQYMVFGFCHQFVPLNITAKQRLDTVVSRVDNLAFGGTDCALPMIYADQNNIEVDTFVVYTDSETWAGSVQPPTALDRYRQHSGIDARLVVVGMTANRFSIADPKDAGMMDVVGFDLAAPDLITQFSAGNL